MSRWFRVYDDLVDDPKIQRLPGETVKALLNIWCLASQNDGMLPAADDIAFKLRMKPAKVEQMLSVLGECGLIDSDETGLRPHNWNARQFKSDVSNERVKQHRERKRNVTPAVTHTVTGTPPETEQRQSREQISEADASGADAPIDHRKRLFNEGLGKLAAMTGKGPDACRSFVGKCLKAASDDAVTVLGLIEEAERNQVVNPSAWIAARLKPVEIGNAKAKPGIIQAADDLCRKIASFDGPESQDIAVRDTAGAPATRLLSHG